jgi:hypothetical protein
MGPGRRLIVGAMLVDGGESRLNVMPLFLLDNPMICFCTRRLIIYQNVIRTTCHAQNL